MIPRNSIYPPNFHGTKLGQLRQQFTLLRIVVPLVSACYYCCRLLTGVVQARLLIRSYSLANLPSHSLLDSAQCPLLAGSGHRLEITEI